MPLEIARRAVDLMELAEDATAMGNPNAASDGMSAAGLLVAAVIGARANVEINATSLQGRGPPPGLLDEVAGDPRARADAARAVQGSLRPAPDGLRDLRRAHGADLAPPGPNAACA